MRKLLFLLSVTLLSCFSGSLSAMKVTGKLTVTTPTDIVIETPDGEPVLRIAIPESGELSPTEAEILPDVYVFRIGESKEYLYLDNSDLVINGYLDPSDAAKSSLQIDGIEANSRFQVVYDRYKTSRGDASVLADYGTSGKATPEMLAAMVRLTPPNNYEEYLQVQQAMEPGIPATRSGQWMNRQIESLYAYRVGGPAYDFEMLDEQGNTVKLSDFRGKYVILDFWASWCGPCKAEMKRMKEYYPEFADKEIVFISLSLDNTEADWRKGLAEEQIPWVTLWDNSGGMNVSPLKEQYGFSSIPFIVLIDREGNTLARRLRGAAIPTKLRELGL